jgi:hypothetical protein
MRAAGQRGYGEDFKTLAVDLGLVTDRAKPASRDRVIADTCGSPA